MCICAASILLERNDRLSDASGLDNVRTAGILVWSHNGGTALTGFKSLSEITGMMQIAVNPVCAVPLERYVQKASAIISFAV